MPSSCMDFALLGAPPAGSAAQRQRIQETARRWKEVVVFMRPRIGWERADATRFAASDSCRSYDRVSRSDRTEFPVHRPSGTGRRASSVGSTYCGLPSSIAGASKTSTLVMVKLPFSCRAVASGVVGQRVEQGDLRSQVLPVQARVVRHGRGVVDARASEQIPVREPGGDGGGTRTDRQAQRRVHENIVHTRRVRGSDTGQDLRGQRLRVRTAGLCTTDLVFLHISAGAGA